LWREENRRTRRKTVGTRREPTTNSTQIWHKAGIEPASHWREVSVLITAPSLLPASLLLRRSDCKEDE